MFTGPLHGAGRAWKWAMRWSEAEPSVIVPSVLDTQLRSAAETQSGAGRGLGSVSQRCERCWVRGHRRETVFRALFAQPTPPLPQSAVRGN